MKRGPNPAARPVAPALDRAQAAYRRSADSRQQMRRYLAAILAGAVVGMGVALTTLGLPR